MVLSLKFYVEWNFMLHKRKTCNLSINNVNSCEMIFLLLNFALQLEAMLTNRICSNWKDWQNLNREFFIKNDFLPKNSGKFMQLLSFATRCYFTAAPPKKRESFQLKSGFKRVKSHQVLFHLPWWIVSSSASWLLENKTNKHGTSFSGNYPLHQHLRWIASCLRQLEKKMERGKVSI